MSSTLSRKRSPSSTCKHRSAPPAFGWLSSPAGSRRARRRHQHGVTAQAVVSASGVPFKPKLLSTRQPAASVPPRRARVRLADAAQAHL